MKTITLILLCFFVSFASLSQRVLTASERGLLVTHTVFREKCEWAIRDYASFWKAHDGASLNTTERAKWRREYEVVKRVVAATYQDNTLALRFVILAKGMQFNLDSDPTDAEIIELFVSTGKFEELASLYFDLVLEGQ